MRVRLRCSDNSDYLSVLLFKQIQAFLTEREEQSKAYTDRETALIYNFNSTIVTISVTGQS